MPKTLIHAGSIGFIVVILGAPVRGETNYVIHNGPITTFTDNPAEVKSFIDGRRPRSSSSIAYDSGAPNFTPFQQTPGSPAKRATPCGEVHVDFLDGLARRQTNCPENKMVRFQGGLRYADTLEYDADGRPVRFKDGF
ncbi:hypothetical protein WDZ92_28090 [Nostoc sp. NIES-2111]